MNDAPFERFYAFRRFEPTLAFAPDESVVFSCNISGQHNLWKAKLDGGWPEQLTAFTANAVRSVVVRAQDGLCLFSADEDGDEFHQLYLLAPGGWPQRITDAPTVQHFLLPDAFAPDGSRYAYAANARTPTDMEVWIRDVDDGEAVPVFGKGLFAVPAAWAPDGTQLLANDIRSNTDASIFLVQADGRGARELTPHEGEALFIPGPWSQDGRGFFFRTNFEREFSRLAFFDLDAGTWAYLDDAERDIDEVAGSRDGREAGWIENDRGWARLRLRDRPDPQLPQGSIFFLGAGLTFSPDGRHAALIWDQARRPQEVYVVDVETGAARPVTESRIGMPRPEELVEPELVGIPTWDGRETPAWLYRPKTDGPAPYVLSVHGGPESQERPAYKPVSQYLCSRGIGVLATNIRGSSGYGKSYQQLVHRDWGGGDLRDLEHATLWLRDQEWADAERIGVAGASYGGFATLSCLSRLPELFAVGVDIVGPSNLITLTRAVPPTWKRFIAALIGDPDDDAEFLRERSPLTYAEAIRAPLLVIQGAKDPRVVKAESDQLVDRLRELGREVEYVVFDDEGHGFTRYANEVRAWRLAAEFLERHLVRERVTARLSPQ